MKKFWAILVLSLVCAIGFTACSGVEFKINFVVDNGVYATVNTNGGETIKMPENPTKEDYTFDGWFWDKDVWEKPFTANSLLDAPLSSDMSVYAKFKSNHNHEHNYIATITAPTCTEKGYTTYTCECGDSYKGDYVDELEHEFTNYVSDNNATYESDGTKTAYCDRGCGATDTVIDTGSKLVKNGIVFKTLNVDGTNVYGKVPNTQATFSFINEVEIKGNATFVVSTDIYGIQQIPTKTVPLEIGDNTFYITETVGNDIRLFTITVRRRPIYTVSFNTDGGTFVSSQQVEEDSFATEPTTTTTKEGYTFNGWIYDFTTPITNNTTIKANWQIINYAVTYNLNGGINNENNPDKYTVEQAVTLSAPTRKGYTFISWSDNGKIAKGSVGDKTFTASWQIIEYAITYNLNGGTNNVNNPDKYTVEQAVTLSAPTKKGYTFTGWSDNGKIEKGTIDNKVFTASWTANTDTPYKIEYYLQNLEDDNYTLYETENLKGTTDTIATATKTYEHFTVIDSTKSANINGNGNTVLKVYYTRNRYTIKILAGDNVALNRTYNGSYKYGYQIEEITANFNHYLGYEWIGWYINNKLLTKDFTNPSFTVDKNVDYIAKSDIKKEMVNFNFTSTTNTCTITGVKDKTVTEIVVPDYVTSIGNYVFYGCSGLTSITIGNSVTSIGDSAFRGCSGLTSITIPNGVSSIGELAFHGCSGLTSVTIGNSVTSIGWHAFSDCSKLTSVTIGNSVTSIEGSAFSGCSGLTSITIPDGVKSIGADAFADCSELTGVYITDIAKWCNISFGNFSSNPLYCAHNLYLNNKLVTNLVIPDSVTSIGDSAFRGCSKLTSVTIPDSVTSIGEGAFGYCVRLTSVNYTGTIEEWNAISKGSYWKSYVPSSCVVHCTDGDIEI